MKHRSESIISPLSRVDFIFGGERYLNIRVAVFSSLSMIPLDPDMKSLKNTASLNMRLCASMYEEIKKKMVPHYTKIYPHIGESVCTALVYLLYAVSAMLVQNPYIAATVIEHGRDYSFRNSVYDQLFGKVAFDRYYDERTFRWIHGNDLYGKTVRFISRQSRREKFPELVGGNSGEVAILSDPLLSNWQELGRKAETEYPWKDPAFYELFNRIFSIHDMRR